MNIDPAIFAQLGVAGVMLYWFMVRFERKLDANTAVLVELSQAILLDVASRENISDRVRVEAHKLLEQSKQRTAAK